MRRHARDQVSNLGRPGRIAIQVNLNHAIADLDQRDTAPSSKTGGEIDPQALTGGTWLDGTELQQDLIAGPQIAGRDRRFENLVRSGSRDPNALQRRRIDRRRVVEAKDQFARRTVQLNAVEQQRPLIGLNPH